LLCPQDTFTYCALMVGILRAGYQAFPISTRNSAIAIAHLLQQTGSKYMFVSDDPGIQRLAAATCIQSSISRIAGVNLHLLPVPSFESLFEVSDDMFSPLIPMEHPAEFAPALILHSSGSIPLYSCFGANLMNALIRNQRFPETCAPYSPNFTPMGATAM
jgi:long-subunit acyl-CoA synthetase (AMP-forming)